MPYLAPLVHWRIERALARHCRRNGQDGIDAAKQSRKQKHLAHTGFHGHASQVQPARERHEEGETKPNRGSNRYIKRTLSFSLDCIEKEISPSLSSLYLPERSQLFRWLNRVERPQSPQRLGDRGRRRRIQRVCVANRTDLQQEALYNQAARHRFALFPHD